MGLKTIHQQHLCYGGFSAARLANNRDNLAFFEAEIYLINGDSSLCSKPKNSGKAFTAQYVYITVHFYKPFLDLLPV